MKAFKKPETNHYKLMTKDGDIQYTFIAREFMATIKVVTCDMDGTIASDEEDYVIEDARSQYKALLKRGFVKG
jgi:hypothetical protein